MHSVSAAGSARSTRELVGCETGGVVRGVAVDAGSGCGVSTPRPFAETESQEARFAEASPRAEASVAARVEGGFEVREDVALVGSEGVVRGRRGEPGLEGAAVVVLSLDGAGDDGHVDAGSGVAEAGPEAAVAVGLAAKFRVGVAAGVGVEEGGRVVVGGDGELVVEVPAGVVEGAGVGALWEVGGREAAAEEVLELVDFGGKPRQGEVFGDVIEAEKATEKDEGARGAAVSDVRDVEGAKEGASVDVSDLEGGAGNEAFAGESGVDQATDQAVSGHPVTLVKVGVLPAGEDAGMEADEGEPGGVSRRETESEEGLFAAGEMEDLEGPLHGRKSMARCVWR